MKKIFADRSRNKVETSKDANELDPEVKALIKKELENQLPAILRELLIPEIRKAIADTLREELQKGHLLAKPSVETPADTLTAYQEKLPLVLEEEILPLEEKLLEVTAGKPLPSVRPGISVKDIRLGIDFGTSTTAVSVRIGDEQAVALPIGRNGEPYMPSVVYFGPGVGALAERVIVGEEAERMNDETQVVRSIKRCFGCEGGLCSSQNRQRFSWCNGDGTIKIGAEILFPSQIALIIIREALSRAARIINDRFGIEFGISDVGPTSINFGCGANFNLAQRKVILETAKELGLPELKIKNVVEEPILAGLAFSRFSDTPEGRSVIYDFGGGTLDIAIVDVVRKDGKPFVTVLATAGENWVGGDDIDNLVYKEFVAQIADQLNAPSDDVENVLGLIDRLKLRQEAKTAKERLSSLEQFEDAMLLEQLGTVKLSLTREKFERILNNSPLVDQSMDAMLRALKLARALDIAKNSDLLDIRRITDLHFEEAVQTVDRVVLVGGVTKIPFIQNRIKHVFGADKVIEEKVFDPISAVSIGAAYPKEAEHFSISTPPFHFFLEGKQKGKVKREVILEAYTYLKFYKMIHANSIPMHNVHYHVDDEYHAVTLMGKQAGEGEVKEIKDLGNLDPGNYEFHIGLDGSLVLMDKDLKPRTLGRHPFTHPLQDQIWEEKERRIAEENKPSDKSRADEYIALLNEN